ncbi:MAG: YggT family protein, partial [Dehalococcoidia bacterium]
PQVPGAGKRMNDTVAQLFTIFLYLLIFAIVGRALLSWFPSMSRTNPVAKFLYAVTEPMLEPVRRFMPRTGMIDLAPMLVIVVLWVMIFVVARAADA